jgi:hypothetical protein
VRGWERERHVAHHSTATAIDFEADVKLLTQPSKHKHQLIRPTRIVPSSATRQSKDYRARCHADAHHMGGRGPFGGHTRNTVGPCRGTLAVTTNHPGQSTPVGTPHAPPQKGPALPQLPGSASFVWVIDRITLGSMLCRHCCKE